MDSTKRQAGECCGLNNTVNSNKETKIDICQEHPSLWIIIFPKKQSIVTLKYWGDFKNIYRNTFIFFSLFVKNLFI